MDFTEFGDLTEGEINQIITTHGLRTLNQIREEEGMNPIPGGEEIYLNWVRRINGLPPITIH